MRKQKDTLRALGLRHHQAEVVKVDNPMIRGMIRVVSHLVVVEEVD
jgi:large subunit ribosomal protein L30